MREAILTKTQCWEYHPGKTYYGPGQAHVSFTRLLSIRIGLLCCSWYLCMRHMQSYRQLGDIYTFRSLNLFGALDSYSSVCSYYHDLKTVSFEELSTHYAHTDLYSSWQQSNEQRHILRSKLVLTMLLPVLGRSGSCDDAQCGLGVDWPDGCKLSRLPQTI